MAKFSELVTYFEDIARNHVSIRHTELEKHFFRFEIDEMLSAQFRSDTNFIFLALEGYNFGFTDNNSDNLLKNRHGAFVIMDHISDLSDYASMHDKWDELEIIGDDIIAKIKSDKRNPMYPVIRDFKFDSITADLILNEIAGGIGIRYTFTLTSPTSNDVDPVKWLTTGSGSV
ncbi:MAG: hypothetical protein HQ541_08580 [Mariniphaga sp.]|nr:hypothetical protein [Mariniphaga sp.]